MYNFMEITKKKKKKNIFLIKENIYLFLYINFIITL